LTEVCDVTPEEFSPVEVTNGAEPFIDDCAVIIIIDVLEV
jgi:hypothetical protein